MLIIATGESVGMDSIPALLGYLLFGYILGSIPFGLLIVRAARGVDVRRYGSGNIGTVNVYRVAGFGPGVGALLSDALKGFVPVFVVGRLGAGPWAVVLTAVAAIVGHNWSAFLKGQGGKGVATSLGVLCGLSPLVAAISFLVWAVFVGITRYSSVGSIAGAAIAPVLMLWLGDPAPYVVFGFVAAAFIVIRHLSNISRLVRGKELRIDKKVDDKTNKG